MGRQVKLYPCAEDREMVDTFVGGLKSVFLKERSTTATPQRVARSAEVPVGCYICPESLVGRIEPRYIPARNEWVIGVADNPVVEWWYSRLEGDILYPGRFYYLPTASTSAPFPKQRTASSPGSGGSRS